MTGITSAAPAQPASGLHLRAVRLEQFSIGWMLIETGVAVTAGIIAGSLALTSFGFDSVIELVSATLVLRRLRAELRGGHPDEQSERRVLRIIAVTFFVLAAYVLAGSVIDLATRAHPEQSPAGARRYRKIHREAALSGLHGHINTSITGDKHGTSRSLFQDEPHADSASSEKRSAGSREIASKISRTRALLPAGLPRPGKLTCPRHWCGKPSKRTRYGSARRRTWVTRRSTVPAARLTLKHGWQELWTRSRRERLILTGTGSTGA